MGEGFEGKEVRDSIEMVEGQGPGGLGLNLEESKDRRKKGFGDKKISRFSRKGAHIAQGHGGFGFNLKAAKDSSSSQLGFPGQQSGRWKWAIIEK